MENPEMVGSDPVPMPGEVFVLSRDGISFSAKSGRRAFDSTTSAHTNNQAPTL